MGARGADKRDPRVLVSGGGAGGGCGGWCRFYRRARCGGEPQGHGTQRDKQKWTLPAPNSIEFGVGKVDFGTERDQKAPDKKLTSVSPCFKGLKSNNAVGKQPTKK